MKPGNEMALTLERSNLRMFGIDLAAVPAYLRDGWAEAMQWPAFRWLTPEAAVRVIHADGSESVRRGVSATVIPAPDRVRFTALELPEDNVLRRSLVLPRLADEELLQAVELDVRSASPFAEEDLAWGYVIDRSGGERVRVDIALTSRRLIERQIDAHHERLGHVPEVWIGGARPFAISGYGESARLGQARKQRRGLVALLALALLLIAALAVTPTLQLRETALDADARSQALSRAVKPQAQMRDELARLGEQLRQLSKAAGARPDVVALLDEVTRQLPDDAMLTRLEFSGSTVRLNGQADNAAQLLQSLGAHAGFRDVRAPAGIARAQAGGKESFTIEFAVGEAR
jgi:general secretion pathway protein L